MNFCVLSSYGLAVLVFLRQLQDVEAASKVLASSKKRVAAQKNLWYNADRLAHALYGGLDFQLLPESLILSAARDRLGRKVNALASRSPDRAQLLRSYIRRAPAAVLVFPSAFPSEFSEEAGFFDGLLSLPLSTQDEDMLSGILEPGNVTDSFKVLSSSMSEQVSYQIDGEGDVMEKKVHCENGVCEESTSLGRMQANGSSAKNQTRTNASHLMVENDLQAAAPFNSDWLDDSISRAADGMVDAMRDTRRIFGQQTLDHMLDDMFESTAALRGNATGSMRLPADLFNMSSMSSNESVSSETVLENGHLLERTTVCQNGNCTTKIEKSNATQPQSPKVNDTFFDQTMM